MHRFKLSFDFQISLYFQVFNTVFNLLRWKTKKNVTLNKKEISPLAFRYILEWMYTGQVNL